MKMININEDADKYLPQAKPMMFIDKVIASDVKANIITEKTVDIDDIFFKGHFPSHPVVPGTCMIEMMLQSCGVLLTLIYKKAVGSDVTPGIGHVAKILSATFIKEVLPQSTIRFNCHMEAILMNFSVFSVTATIDDEKVATAKFVLAS